MIEDWKKLAHDLLEQGSKRVADLRVAVARIRELEAQLAALDAAVCDLMPDIDRVELDEAIDAAAARHRARQEPQG